MTSTTTEETRAEAIDETEGDFALAQPYEVPSEGAFQGREFIIDPSDLKTIARDLIDDCEEFYHLRGASIEYAWKRKGGMANGGTQEHGHKRTDTHAAAHGAKEFLIWVAADIARERPYTAEDVEAAMYHEHCHLGYNENAGEVKIVDEPVKYFPSEKRRYGLSEPQVSDDEVEYGSMDDDETGSNADDPFDKVDPTQPVGALPGLEAHLAQHPEQIEALERSAGEGPNDLTETIATAKRGRRGRAAADVAEGAQAT